MFGLDLVYKNSVSVERVLREESPNRNSRYSSNNIICTVDVDCRSYMKGRQMEIDKSNCALHKVSLAEKNRLDLVAFNYYGDSSLYWVIAYASGLKSPWKVPVGTVLLVPTSQALYGYNGVIGG